MKHGKKYLDNRKKVDPEKEYSLSEAIDLLKDMSELNFDATVEYAARLGINPTKADQQVRGTVMLPHGIGKKVTVMVFAGADKVQEALDAGADYAGSDEYFEKIQDGWFDFDVAIATPDMMGEVGKLGRFLGPRGLMPNPKAGTVTNDIARTVQESKTGKLEYRADKYGNIHMQIGKLSFDADKIADNTRALTRELLRARPASAKGRYFLSIHLSSTMSPSVKVDRTTIIDIIR
jgi:large subunit ribosomal protein L1